MVKRLALLITIAFFLLACTNPGLSSPTASIPANGLVVLGLVSGNSAVDASRIQPLADYLAGQLSGQGITAGQVRIAGSVDEMADWLAQGEVDLYIDSAYPALLVSEKTGAELILRSWQFSSPEVQAVIFASRSSGINSLEELPGNMVVMNARNSTTGFFLPAARLVEDGLALSGKSSFNDPVSSTEVGLMFSGSAENTLQAVLSGYAVAGAVDDYYFDVAFPPEATQKLVELARTEKVPRQVVLARPGLDSQYLSLLRDILTRMHESGAGKSALDAFQTSRFDSIPNETETVRRMRTMLAAVMGIPLP
jgi:phosphonate transport system substrate-binding protein